MSIEDILLKVLISLLTIDTIRAFVAMLGWIKPDSKFAWIIYGRYERNLIVSALKDLGFKDEKRKIVIKSLKKTASDIPKMTGITAEDAAVHLIILLAKYTVKFSDEIRYGEGVGLTSNYYIDTMEISHNEDDLRKLSAIMTFLVSSKTRKRPDVIISPKGGNPIFSKYFASSIQTKLLIAKPVDDNSRIRGNNIECTDYFKINYEGSWDLLNTPKELYVTIADCNTTDGAQLLSIIGEINRLAFNGKYEVRFKIEKYAFVLFCANEQARNLDEKFKKYNVDLVRFFDLDETTKSMLYELKTRCEIDYRVPNCLNDEDQKAANAIIDVLKTEGKFYY